MRLILLALLVAGLGASAFSLHAQTSAKKKSSATSSRRGSKTAKRAPARRDKGQKAPTTERVSEIQQALSKDGSFSGTPSGKWDDSTVAAMKKFQAGHGLNPSGKLDARTLQQLGLGSKTAGLGAPSTPVRISSSTGPQSDSVGDKQ
jgi:peptidoglycan hydrolase-like protein with peptidoglycan-binding domain